MVFDSQFPYKITLTHKQYGTVHTFYASTTAYLQYKDESYEARIDWVKDRVQALPKQTSVDLF